MCSFKYLLWFLSLIFTHYRFFTSSMWLISSCGSPSSNTTSMQRCRRSSRPSSELEERSVDHERGFCGMWETSRSIFSPVLQQPVSSHPPPQQPWSACSTSRSSMLSETSLTLGGGFSKAFLIPSVILSSCCETCCKSSVTLAGTGVSGCSIWHQHHTALWWDTQRGNSVSHNGTEKWLGLASAGQKRYFNNGRYKRGSWCFCARTRLKS